FVRRQIEHLDALRRSPPRGRASSCSSPSARLPDESAYLLFLSRHRINPDFHNLSTAALHLPIPFDASLPHNSYGQLHPSPPLPKTSYSSPSEAKEAKLRTVLLDVHERACAFFQECLRRPEGARAREYLAGRGLDEETIRRFRIGYAPDSGFLLRDRLKGEFD